MAKKKNLNNPTNKKSNADGIKKTTSAKEPAKLGGRSYRVDQHDEKMGNKITVGPKTKRFEVGTVAPAKKSVSSVKKDIRTNGAPSSPTIKGNQKGKKLAQNKFQRNLKKGN
jgi:hypothetical protein